MKSGRAHRVPLAHRAVELLASQLREDEFIFVGRKRGSRQSSEAMRLLLRRMGQLVTAHGFRSSFRDWAAETTAYPNHVVEQALAHAMSNAVEAAYQRGDLLQKRRRLMEDWAKYCGKPIVRTTGEVVPLRSLS